MTKMKAQHIYLFRVPANKEGEEFISQFKKVLNSDTYKVRRMYTGKRPKGTNQGATRKENADSIRVYIDTRVPRQSPYLYDDIKRTSELQTVAKYHTLAKALREVVSHGKDWNTLPRYERGG